MTLLDRFGGDLKIEEFVNGFYDLMSEDAAIKEAFKGFSFRVLKDRTIDYLVSDFGNGVWNGPDLFESHHNLHVTVRQFDVMMTCIGKQLKKMKVGGALNSEIVARIEGMREQICDPDGKLNKALKDKVASLMENSKKEDDVDIGLGADWAVDKETMAQWKNEQKRRELLKEKLAAQKRQRQLQEKMERQQQKASAKQKSKSSSSSAKIAKTLPKESKILSATVNIDSTPPLTAETKSNAQLTVSEAPLPSLEGSAVLPPSSLRCILLTRTTQLVAA